MAAPPSSSSSNGTLILVLGIVSLFCTILGPFAWIMGNNALQTADPSQAGTINAGRICGIIGTVFLILGVIWAILWFSFVGAMMHHAASSFPTTPASP